MWCFCICSDIHRGDIFLYSTGSLNFWTALSVNFLVALAVSISGLLSAITSYVAPICEANWQLYSHWWSTNLTAPSLVYFTIVVTVAIGGASTYTVLGFLLHKAGFLGILLLLWRMWRWSSFNYRRVCLVLSNLFLCISLCTGWFLEGTYRSRHFKCNCPNQ